MIIEGLVPDPRRPGSIRVVVGGRPAWTVPADVIHSLALTEGARLPGPAIERLDEAADEEGAFRSALRSLERRAHGRVELTRKLERKGHPEKAVAAAIDRLGQLELLDDLGFSRLFVAGRSDRGRGPIRLQHDLRALGIDAAVIAQVLAELARDTHDPLAQPRALAARRAAQLHGLPRDTRRRRLGAFLARRGFGGYDARTIIDDVLAADHE